MVVSAGKQVKTWNSQYQVCLNILERGPNPGDSVPHTESDTLLHTLQKGVLLDASGPTDRVYGVME